MDIETCSCVEKLFCSSKPDDTETGYFKLYNTQLKVFDLCRIDENGKMLVVKRNVDKPGLN